MNDYMIKDISLASKITEGQIAWVRHICPITDHFSQQISRRNYQGKKVAYWGHVADHNLILVMTALKKAGAEIIIGACNVDSTNDEIAAYLASRQIGIYAWKGMTNEEYKQNLIKVREFNADYLCDMGG